MLWYVTATAAYALANTISISLLGGVATAFKAWRDPYSETLVTWVIALMASVLALCLIGTMDLVLLAYPAYLLVLNSMLICAIVFGANRKRLLLQVATNRSAWQKW